MTLTAVSSLPAYRLDDEVAAGECSSCARIAYRTSGTAPVVPLARAPGDTRQAYRVLAPQLAGSATASLSRTCAAAANPAPAGPRPVTGGGGR